LARWASDEAVILASTSRGNQNAVKCCASLFAVALSIVAPPAAQAGSSGYQRTKTIALGGEGRWDLLAFDSDTRRLFIARETRVTVLDVDRQKVVGEVSETQGVHGIALAPELGRGFASNGRADSMTIFDLNTLKAIGTVGTGAGPDAIVYDPTSRLVVAMNGHGQSATVVEAASGAVKGTLELGGKPEFAVADGRGRIFANLEDKSEELEIDPRALTIVHRWPLAPCSAPTGLAIDREHRRLLAGCSNHLMAVVDADSGRIVATPAIGDGVDANAFDRGTQLAFSSNGEGTLTVVREKTPDQFNVLEEVRTQRGARTMALDEKTHEIYLVTADLGPAPAPSAAIPVPRPSVLPGTFIVLVYGRPTNPE
jgi:DNA-binding beta-propeller fold protein YncE